jgi:hypothetical protein
MRSDGPNVPVRRSAMNCSARLAEGVLLLRRQAAPVAPERREDVIRRHPTSLIAREAPRGTRRRFRNASRSPLAFSASASNSARSQSGVQNQA